MMIQKHTNLYLLHRTVLHNTHAHANDRCNRLTYATCTHSHTSPCAPTQPLSHSATQPLSHSATQTLSHSATQLLSYSATQPLTQNTVTSTCRHCTRMLRHTPKHPNSRIGRGTNTAISTHPTARASQVCHSPNCFKLSTAVLLSDSINFAELTQLHLAFMHSD
jgi:hypothetical protein